MVWQKELEEEEAVLDMDDGVSKDGSRMLRDEVTPDDIASVVASWTGDCIGQAMCQRCPDSSPPKTKMTQIVGASESRVGGSRFESPCCCRIVSSVHQHILIKGMDNTCKLARRC